MTEVEARLAIIETALQGFCDEFLCVEEAEDRLFAVFEAAKKSRKLNLTRGEPEIWAAAIAYAFARMNFLLDDEGPMHIERDEFFDLFAECSRSTVTQKATRVEKALNFHYGHPKFCLPEVVDAMPKFKQAPSGVIVPESLNLGKSAGGREIVVSFMSEEESMEMERQLAEQKKAEKEEKVRLRHEELRRKREEERKTQPELFDLGD